MTVTELREIKPRKYLVGFSDGSELRIGPDLVAELSLYVGRELSSEEFEGICKSAAFYSCRVRAFNIIGARPLSRKELYDKLVMKGESSENARRCVEWMVERRFLNDAEYAAMLVRHYSAKGYGKARIKNEFYHRGIDKELWDEALSQAPSPDDKIDALLRRKLKSSNPDRAELKKATDALYRRGFSWEEIKSAVNRLEEENYDITEE